MEPVRGNEIVPLGYAYADELKKRLEKLSRTYDLTTMKIFMTVEAVGESNVYGTYDQEKKPNWEIFLDRREACRLDLSRHDKTREKYQQFLTTVGREDQGKQFFHSMIALLQTKGATNVFKHSTSKYQKDLDTTFCGHLCKLFDKKVDAWFDTFEAVNVKLTAHVKVSNFVRVLTGQIDLLCRKDGLLYAVNVKVTGMPSPRPMDVNELCLVKAMVIQNGLSAPEYVVPCLLVCHLGEDRPVLRLWEYRPTREMDQAIREADIDAMIDAGKLSQHHEMWLQNVCPPLQGSVTARYGITNINGSNGYNSSRSIHHNNQQQQQQQAGNTYNNNYNSTTSNDKSNSNDGGDIINGYPPVVDEPVLRGPAPRPFPTNAPRPSQPNKRLSDNNRGVEKNVEYGRKTPSMQFVY